MFFYVLHMNTHNFVVTFSSSIKKVKTWEKKNSNFFGLFVFSVNRNIFYYKSECSV